MCSHGTVGFGSADVPKVVADSMFKALDTNSNKELDESELTVLVEEQLGLSSERAEAALMLMDKDGSGSVDQEEFTAWLRSKQGVSILADEAKYQVLCKAMALFNHYDEDGSRTLNKSELGQLLESMGLLGGDVSVDSAFDGLDLDNNGLVSFSEFLKWLNWLPSPMVSPKPVSSNAAAPETES